MCYRIGDLEIDPARRYIRRGGSDLYLRLQSFEVLAYLLKHRDRVVPKEELHQVGWKGVAVGDDAIVQCIADIRRALGDDSRSPVYIKTLPKLGYRFIGPVDAIDATAAPEPVAAIDVPRPRARFRLAAVAGACVLLVATAVAGWRLWPSADTPAGGAAAPAKRIAVVEFENRSQHPDFAWLGRGLAEMVITDLSRFEGVSLVLAREIGAAQLMVRGAFTVIGDSVRLEIRLHDATGALVGAEHATAETPSQIFANVELLSLKVAGRMGLPSDARTGPGAAAVLTTNLEAYRYYALGLARSDELLTKEAIEMFEKAIALDQGFAMAQARIGYVYAVRHSLVDRAKPYLQRAFENPARLTERDRMQIAAWYAIANQDYDEAIVQCRAILQRYPEDIEVAGRLANLLHGESRLEEARDVALRAYAIDATNPAIVNMLGGTYSLLGRHADAIAMFQRYVALAPSQANPYDSLGLAYQWAGQYEDAIAAYQKAIALDPGFEVAIIHLGNVYFLLGRYRDALRQFERYIAAGEYDQERHRGYAAIAYVHLERGELDAAQAAADKGQAPYEQFLIAEARGDRRAAEKYLRAGTRVAGRGAGTSRRFLEHLEGRFARLTGRPEEALVRFRAALRFAPATYSMDALEDMLGQAYLELGRFDDAIAEFERVLAINPNLAAARLGLARAYDRKGDTPRARTEYEAFVRIWRNADADAPDLVATKRRLAALGANRTQARVLNY